MDIAQELGSLLTFILSPPLYPPGSLAAGSAVEDRNLARHRTEARRRLDALRDRPMGVKEREALAALDGMVGR